MEETVPNVTPSILAQPSSPPMPPAPPPTKPKTFPYKWLVLFFVVLVILGVAIYVATSTQKRPQVAEVVPTATVIPTSTPKVDPVITTAEGGEISESDIQRLELGLASQDLSVNKSVLIKDVRKNLTKPPLATPGAKFNFDRKTFKATARYASIEGDLLWNSSSERYILWLMKEQDGSLYHWNIATTAKKSEYNAAQ